MNQGDELADVSAKGTDGAELGPEEGPLDPKVGAGRAGMRKMPGAHYAGPPSRRGQRPQPARLCIAEAG